MNIYEKLAEARRLVRETPHKKEGHAGQFDYFTPTQVETIVAEACETTKLLPLCNLERHDDGLVQTMTLVDIENPEDNLIFELATEKGALRNTNESQNMGSTDTYSERYLKQKVFQIKDNNLDPDANSGNTTTKNEIDDILA